MPRSDSCTNAVIWAGSNFGLPSPGHTTLTRLGPPDSDFDVDSFFDITYEIDFQGAPGSVLDGMAGTTQGTLRISTGDPLLAPPEPITFNFTGTVTSQAGIWAGQGGAVSGFYTYDTLLLDALVGDTQGDLFRSVDPGNHAFAWEISVTVGAVTRTTASNQNAAGTTHHYLEVLDRAGEDRFRLRGERRIVSDDSAQIAVVDFSPVPPDGIAVGSSNLTDTAPTTAPNVALFDTVVGWSFYEPYTAAGFSEGNLIFTLTSVVPVPVPEPGTATLNVVGGQLMGASGVDVGGTLYNVQFLDGTCSARYSGCDSASDFMFQSEIAALLASQALLDQVFLDGADLFDTDPSLTNGCTEVSCMAWTPYSASSSAIPAARAFNEDGVVDAVPAARVLKNPADFSAPSGSTWAVWSPVPEPVPSSHPIALYTLPSLLAGVGLVVMKRL